MQNDCHALREPLNWLKWPLQMLKLWRFCMFKHISAFCTRTLACRRGWLTVSCDMQQRGAQEWENLRLSVYVGGGNRESPFHSIAPSKCRLRDPERGGVDGARTPWERWAVCVWVRESLCSVRASSSSSSIHPSLHPALSALHCLV